METCFLQAILEFKLQPDTLAAHLRALTELKTTSSASGKWVKPVLKGSEDVLSKTVTQLKAGSPWEQGGSLGSLEKRVTAAIFTLGKVFCPQLSL